MMTILYHHNLLLLCQLSSCCCVRVVGGGCTSSTHESIYHDHNGDGSQDIVEIIIMSYMFRLFIVCFILYLIFLGWVIFSVLYPNVCDVKDIEFYMKCFVPLWEKNALVDINFYSSPYDEPFPSEPIFSLLRHSLNSSTEAIIELPIPSQVRSYVVNEKNIMFNDNKAVF